MQTLRDMHAYNYIRNWSQQAACSESMPCWNVHSP